MQIIKTISCFMLMGICVQYIYAQALQPVASNNNLLFGNTEYIKTDSGLIINQYFKNGCKNYLVKRHFTGDSVKVPMEIVATVYKEPAKPKFIIVHGNVSYDFFYRSKIDTPFAQQNLQQHTERVWLDVLFREKYPFKIGFTARESNSPFFRDLYCMNLNFDRYGYTKNIKQDLLNRLQVSKWQNPNLKLVDTVLKEQLKQYQALKNWINGPEALQKLIEAKEKLFYYNQKKIAGDMDMGNGTQIIPVSHKIKLSNGQWFSFKTDSVIAKTETGLPKPDSSFIKLYQSKKDQLSKLEQSIAVLEHQSDSLKKSITQGINKIKQLIYQAKTPKDLDKIAIENNIPQPKKEKLQNFLTNVKSFGIGRNMVDYTALTAQNIMLTGVNVEYNPSYYAAFAAGKIDYGFRDFFGRSIKQKNQYLVLGRMGWGDKDKHAVILTVFNGRKNNFSPLQLSIGNICF